MTNVIAEQRRIAMHVIKRLALLDSQVILAGGAPRDWMKGQVANDLDFYLYRPEDSPIQRDLYEVLNGPFDGPRLKGMTRSQFKERKEELGDGSIDQYDFETSDLTAVYETGVFGFKIQIMQWERPLEDGFDVVNSFMFSDSMLMLDRNFRLNVSPAYRVTSATGKIYCREPETDIGKKYYDKIAARHKPEDLLPWDNFNEDLNRLYTEQARLFTQDFYLPLPHATAVPMGFADWAQGGIRAALDRELVEEVRDRDRAQILADAAAAMRVMEAAEGPAFFQPN